MRLDLVLADGWSDQPDLQDASCPQEHGIEPCRHVFIRHGFDDRRRDDKHSLQYPRSLRSFEEPTEFGIGRHRLDTECRQQFLYFIVQGHKRKILAQ